MIFNKLVSVLFFGQCTCAWTTCASSTYRKNDAAVVLQGGLSTAPVFPMGSRCVTKGIQQNHVDREAAESSFGVIRVQQLLIQCLLSVLVQGSVSIQSIFVMLNNV